MNNSVTERAPVHPAAARLPRLGFAGAGWIGRHRLEAIAGAGAAEVVAVYDPAAESARAALAISPGARRTGSFDELVDADLDGIVIATPNAQHAAQAIAALRAGKAVFCQKPLARTGAETAAVIAAARTADRLLQVDLSYRFTAGMQRIRELIRAGALGRVYAVEAVFHNAYGPDKPWFYDRAQAGGGCLLDLGVHLVDLALWCLDFPRVQRVSSNLLTTRAAGSAGTDAVEDYAAGQLLLAGNVSVQLACSWKAPAGCDADIGLTFFGDRSGAAFRNVGGSFYDFRAEHFSADRARHELAAPPDDWGGRAALAWCRQLAIAPGFDPETEHLELVADVLDRLYARPA